MNKRTKATSISSKVRKEVKERDKRCVICGETWGLEIAHVFVNRSHGGLGIKENLALLCKKHHMLLDGGKQREQIELRFRVEQYLRSLYGEIDIKRLKYDKWG